ncbi:MAG: hypothetical protein BWY99_01666 [Synergistetes bacterium ADurb.BinA166]|nr:MAG: hypothetical protein BWY99_01666 [Synergistetes bacterium ADurb.BinA166]
MIKSFGLGVLSAEMVQSTDGIAPNKSILEVVEGHGLPFLEAVESHGRVFLMQADGHRPTKYEMSLFEPSDWEALRTAVAERGSDDFQFRLTELEADRVILEGGPPA